MIKILYAGDYALISHTYIKGMNSWTSGQAFDERAYFLDALREDGELAIDYLPTPYISRDFPSTPEALKKYDAVILSDVGTDTLLLYPDIFKIPMGANRLHLLADYVKEGGGFAAIGGWMSFGGQMGQGKYHGTVLEDILNVNASPYDDRVEVPEGFRYNPVKNDHPLIKDMGWEKSPLLFLGYNRFEARDSQGVLAEYNGDPMIVANRFGKGNTMAFASDLAPHWGQGFVSWENYSKFWGTCCRWLAGRL